MKIERENELNKEQILKALEIYRDTLSVKRCAVCVMAIELKGLCEPLLFEHVIALINQQDELIKKLKITVADLQSRLMPN